MEYEARVGKSEGKDSQSMQCHLKLWKQMKLPSRGWGQNLGKMPVSWSWWCCCWWQSVDFRFLFFYFNNFDLFIFWLWWVSIITSAFLSVTAGRGDSLAAEHGLLFAVASLIAEHGPEGMGLSSYDSQALEQTQQWWRTGLVAPRHVGSSRIRGWTLTFCVGRWILYHWDTREARSPFPLNELFDFQC